jgi:hypothetical protein
MLRLLLCASCLLGGVLGSALLGSALAQQAASVSGWVVEAGSPVANATVRIRATTNATSSAADGSFTLGELVAGEQVEVTAWADGYYVASAYVTPTVSDLTLTLRRYHTTDHPDYAWTSPVSGTSSGACGNCHPMIFPQWQANAHGGAIENPRFFSMYEGTDTAGSPAGPGYLQDFPGTDGNCANCHAPGRAVDGYLTTNMSEVRGVITAGIHCDFCHKLGGVYLDPATDNVYHNAPGVRSQRVLRPPPGDDIFFGPYDDIHDPDTYLPLISESQFCAPCHQFSFWGTPVYESYGEWLASPYAAEGVTCQDCHMPPTGDEYFALPEVGGLAHPPETIPSHLQLGATSTTLLQETVAMTVTERTLGSSLAVTVVLSNTGAGHHVPTDFPGRHLLLLVSASDGNGALLSLQNGPEVPAWAGSEEGQPGMAYARLLKDVATGEWPVVSYWNPTTIVADNRIPARAAARSTYLFALPGGSEGVQVEARLLLRRLFAPLAAEKGWQVPDIIMEEHSLTVPRQPKTEIYLPLICVSQAENLHDFSV